MLLMTRDIEFSAFCFLSVVWKPSRESEFPPTGKLNNIVTLGIAQDEILCYALM